MKIFQMLFVLAVAPGVPACVTPAASATPAPAVTSMVILKIPYADMVVKSARFEDSTPMETAEPGYKILLVVLERVDQKPVDLQDYTNKQVEVNLLDADGNIITIATMGGMTEDGFVIGFRVTDSLKTYRLQTGDNPAIEIFPTD
jgi:hypothetical protein